MTGPTQPYPLHARMESEEAKDLFRRALRHARAELPERRRADACRKFAAVITSLPEVQQAKCVAAYAARPGEPDLTPVLEHLYNRGVRVLLPVLGDGLRRDWAQYAGAGDLRVRAPGRPAEPGTPALGANAVAQADVVLAPALAVDTLGNRLGQGGGWYDRALAHVRDDAKVLVVVYANEVYDAVTHPIPTEAHDLRVGGVVTPDACLWLTAQGSAR